VVALLVVTFADGLSSLIFGRRRHLEVPFRALPGVLVGAAAAALLSRVFNLQPGFAFGVVASFYVAEIDDDDQGKVSMGAVLGVIVVSLVAWFVWVPARDLASGAHPSFGVLVLEASLASIFIVGIESSLIEALPLRSLHRGCIYGWNRLAWAVMFVVSAAVFIEVLLQPGQRVRGPGQPSRPVADRGRRGLRAVHRGVLVLLPVPARARRRRRRTSRSHRFTIGVSLAAPSDHPQGASLNDRA
jgi:hypothetical protein